MTATEITALEVYALFSYVLLFCIFMYWWLLFFFFKKRPDDNIGLRTFLPPQLFIALSWEHVGSSRVEGGKNDVFLSCLRN